MSWVFWSGAILANTVPCSTSYKAEHTIRNYAQTLVVMETGKTVGRLSHSYSGYRKGSSHVKRHLGDLVPFEACRENAPR